MRAILEGDNLKRVPHPITGEPGDAFNGMAYLKTAQGWLAILFSNGEGWDHVSVSRRDRCPTWDEMCAVKARFFEPEEVVVQYHPAAANYRNFHPYCLHLWRWQGGEFPQPNPGMVA